MLSVITSRWSNMLYFSFSSLSFRLFFIHNLSNLCNCFICLFNNSASRSIISMAQQASAFNDLIRCYIFIQSCMHTKNNNRMTTLFVVVTLASWKHEKRWMWWELRMYQLMAEMLEEGLLDIHQRCVIILERGGDKSLCGWDKDLW